MENQKQDEFKNRIREYMLKHNMKANDAFLESANTKNVRTRKAAGHE